jgi:plasmid stabilization system protein ParE
VKYIVTLSDEAEFDLADALDYYTNISETVGQRLYSEVDQVMQRLSKSPKHYPVRYRSIRIASTLSFSYGIHYDIQKDEVRVIRVLHHKQYYSSEDLNGLEE